MKPMTALYHLNNVQLFQAKAMENFLSRLNKTTSRGIPVGPAPSIVLAQLIMASIDYKIRTYTEDFVRYMDDIRIFFHKREDTIYTLHELTEYLYSYHRLVFSGEKTKVQSVKRFRERDLRDEEREENAAKMAAAEKMALEQVEEAFDNLPPHGYDVRSGTTTGGRSRELDRGNSTG